MVASLDERVAVMQQAHWPEREPLPEQYDVMPFDYELLPAKLRPYIELG